jgi:hypothetical protein
MVVVRVITKTLMRLSVIARKDTLAMIVALYPVIGMLLKMFRNLVVMKIYYQYMVCVVPMVHAFVQPIIPVNIAKRLHVKRVKQSSTVQINAIM